MKVLVTGASGFVGRNLSMALKQAGDIVQPVSRRDGLDMAEMLSPDAWLPHLEGVDAVVNTVGIIGQTRQQRFEALHTQAPVALFQACRQAGVRRVVQVSAIGVDDPSAFSAYHLSKRAADESLLQMGLDAVVIRPALIYGRGGTSSDLFLRVATLPVIPVLDAGEQVLQPVHISDVVATMKQALTGPPLNQSLDVAGPDTVTFAEWMQRLRAAQGRSRGRLLGMPSKLALLGSRLAQPLSPMASSDNVNMLLKGYRGDPKVAERFLGRPLLRFQAKLPFEDASILWRSA